MNEIPKSLPPKNDGGKTGGENSPVVATPAVQPASVVAPPSSAPALFGGHRGGGKKRTDGLVAGSPEAIAADKEKDAARKRADRLQKKVTALPPSLPSAPPSAASAAVPVAPGALAVPAVEVAPMPLAGAPPMFVAWQQKLLDKPAKLIAKITDRWRGYCRIKAVKKLNLSPAAEKEILERMKWKEDVLNDFALALSEATTIELNKRRVPGAEHGHWATLLMSVGEIISLEMKNMGDIERLILEDRKNNPQKTDEKIQ